MCVWRGRRSQRARAGTLRDGLPDGLRITALAAHPLCASRLVVGTTAGIFVLAIDPRRTVASAAVSHPSWAWADFSPPGGVGAGGPAATPSGAAAAAAAAAAASGVVALIARGEALSAVLCARGPPPHAEAGGGALAAAAASAAAATNYAVAETRELLRLVPPTAKPGAPGGAPEWGPVTLSVSASGR